MSLRFYTRKDALPTTLRFIDDIETEFNSEEFKKFLLTAEKSTLEKISRVLYSIDKYRLDDSMQPFDRMGYKAKFSFLSTGSKAILLLLSKSNIVIDACELGINAIYQAILYVDQNALVWELLNYLPPMYEINGQEIDSQHPISITFDEYSFNSVSELNDWIEFGG